MIKNKLVQAVKENRLDQMKNILESEGDKSQEYLTSTYFSITEYF